MGRSKSFSTNDKELRAAVENLSQADFTIRGTDIAVELTLLTQNQILSNVAV